MSPTRNKNFRSHDDVLEAITDEIDIPEHLEEAARKRYRAVGEWMDRDASSIKEFNPEISPQGSFLLGTVTRPIGDTDEYDVDVVCKLNANTNDFTMAELKKAVGEEFKAYALAHNMENEPEDGRRCWTLPYAEQARFHLDLLPALPNETAYRKLLEAKGYASAASDPRIWEAAIAITDKTHPNYKTPCNDWPVSNPKGYAAWFKSRQADAVAVRKKALMESERIYASVDDVPDYKVKTPLQRAVQLLKRHRDVMFDGEDDKPISIIITTLAALAYRGEQTVSGALRTILRGMDDYIETRGPVKWVANPVNPTENFADKWAENPAKEANFWKWLDKARSDFGLYLVASNYAQMPTVLREALSSATVSKVLPAVAAPAVVTGREAAEREVDKIRREGGATKPWRR